MVENFDGGNPVPKEGEVKIGMRIALGKEVIRPFSELLAENPDAVVYVV